MTQEEIFKVIQGERRYQNYRWGQPHTGEEQVLDTQHSVADFILLMENYLLRARKQWCENGGDQAALDELRKVSALTFACFEQHGVPERQFKSVVNARTSEFFDFTKEDKNEVR